jgi:cadmium resistance protein CadD (predicted permease)
MAIWEIAVGTFLGMCAFGVVAMFVFWVLELMDRDRAP